MKPSRRLNTTRFGPTGKITVTPLITDVFILVTVWEREFLMFHGLFNVPFGWLSLRGEGQGWNQSKGFVSGATHGLEEVWRMPMISLAGLC